ncbi:hypothetical protein B0A50_03912 [Salinomyces thailandicus]|uniref:Stress response protein ish1 n=1 Tax=Salinomyces thailandicus TaxID=706561 RepID=A0A4U0U317_9PEZI|nr:hypothetical protein B0A50_03912 [Salinomyces thailandica]
MKFAVTFTVALATCVAGNSWLGNAGRTAYNKWHESELERWLSDHNIPYPAPADRKDLQDLVQENWEDNVVKPYNKWDTHQLSNWLTSQGQEVKKGTEKNKDSLLSQVQSYWKGTADSANDAYANTQSWIFDTWTESQLKAFLDYHDVPNPNPRTRDSLLHTARANYQNIANKVGETASYPGDWLYSQWSDSDLKSWADERGIPVPQPGTRDKLIASMRRNSKVASDRAAEQYSTLSKSASGAQQSLTEQLLDSWSDSEIKSWCDKNGVKVPQGSKRNELVAIARRRSAELTGKNAASSASGYYGAATTSAGNSFAQATDDMYGQFRHYYDYVMNQFGMATADAQSSMSSASARVSSSASSLSSVAEKSASSASKDASKSGLNAASAASSAAKQASASAKSEL